MRDNYRTVASSSQIELEEKKSRFIAVCRPLVNEIEANAFVSGIRQEYPDATHHVYAWILGGETILQRYSDDGEPQGTAGIPVLDVLRKNGIDQAGIVVVRYFGGTLLGTGGLVHASIVRIRSCTGKKRVATTVRPRSKSYRNLGRTQR